MDDYRLQTPEQVDISYTVAGLGTRFMALALDTVLQFTVIGALVASMRGLSRYGRFEEWYVAIMILVIALVYYGYFLIFELLMAGRTPGKAALKIRVVRMDGRAVDSAGILLRNLVRIVDSLPILYTVGIFSMFINRDSRRLGDLAAGTVVVVERREATLSSILSQQQGAVAYHALSNQEYAIIRDFLARRDSLSAEARYRLASTLAIPLYDRFEIPTVQRGNHEVFLQSLLQGSL